MNDVVNTDEVGSESSDSFVNNVNLLITCISFNQLINRVSPAAI